jgi:hypothetical protein
MGWVRNAYKMLVGKLEEKRPLKRPSRCENNIKMDLKEIGYGCSEFVWLSIGTTGGLL